MLVAVDLESRFVLGERAGVGGMATVFRAWDREGAVPVAIKVLHRNSPGTAERLAREARILADLNHLGIVQYVAHGTSRDGASYLAMQWLEGETLAQRLERGPIEPQCVVALGCRVADALSFAHARGVVHRDLKPANIFLEDGSFERVKILDFGMARNLEISGFTKTGGILGTPSYMSPEQARGERADDRADLFALGCVLYACLTGRPPFAGSNVPSTLYKICIELHTPVRTMRPDVPAGLDRLIDRLLAKACDDRPENARSVLLALAEPEGAGGATAGAMASSTSGQSRRPLAPLPPGRGQRVISVLFAAARGDAHEPTLAEGMADDLGDVLEAHRANVTRVLDGSILACFPDAGGPMEQAIRAAQCALAMRRRRISVPLAISTAHGSSGSDPILGKVIDQGVAMLVDDDAIHLDSTTAALLATRFDIDPGEGDAKLRSQRSALSRPRTVAGAATACVGREIELVMLDHVFRECVSERELRSVKVSGAAGAGKSRIAHEFVGRLRERDCSFELIVGRGDSLYARSPFALLGSAVLAAAGVEAEDEIGIRREKLTALVGRSARGERLERLSALLGELAGAPFPDEASPVLHAARRDPSLMASRLASAWSEWLGSLCETCPVVLLLEDVHWADRPSLELVARSARGLRANPIMILALGRTDDRNPRATPPWLGEALTINLPPLGRSACEGLVRKIAGADIPAEILERVVTRAQGNAFCLEELLRHRAAGGVADFPDSMLGMIQARLEKLSTHAATYLRAASVFGERFLDAGVGTLLASSMTEGRASLLDELVGAELLARAGTHYAFEHALVRDAAYATLGDDARMSAHRLAALWLSGTQAPDPLVVAEHFDTGNDPENAAAWYAEGAVHALDSNDLEGARARAERSMQCGVAGEGLRRVRCVLAQLANGRLDFEDAASHAADALEQGPAGDPGWFDALRELVSALANQDKGDLLEEWAKRAASVLPGADVRPKLGCLSWAAGALVNVGRRAPARGLLEDVDAGLIALQVPDPWLMARVDLARGLWWIVDDLSTALAAFQRAVAYGETAGDLRIACEARCNVADALILIGDYESAVALCRKAVADAEQLAVRLLLVFALANLAEASLKSHYVEEARAACGRILELTGPSGGPMYGYARVLLCMADCLQGRHAEAHDDLHNVDAWCAVHFTALRATVGAVLSETSLALGRTDDALSHAQRAALHFEAVDRSCLGMDEARVRLALAAALLATGNEASARDAVHAACERLEERSRRILEPAMRERFFRGVSVNAATMELARNLGVR